MSYDEGHRAYILTPTDRSGLVVIVTTLLMSWMVLCFLTRLYTRWAINGPFGLDDLAAGVGTALGICHVGAVMDSVSHGFGKSKTLLDPVRISKAEKAIYAADILFVIAHTAAKASVAFLLRRLGREKRYMRLCDGVLTIISLWGFASLLAIGLKCGLNHPWLLDGQCKNVLLRWQLITAFDVVTEIGLLSVYVYLIWGLHMRWKGKVVVLIAFGSRVPVIIAAIARVIYLKSALQSPDPPLNGVDASISTEVLLQYSLMAATIPCMKPFVIAFNTGWGLGTKGNRNSHLRQSDNTGKEGSSSNRSSNPVPSTTISPAFRTDFHQHQTCVANATATVVNERPDSIDSIDSHESQRMIIRETREWAVEHENIEMRHYPGTPR
ncbi:hypothetical protein VTN00DRAFT_2819 [Thermoascus crustaceus]|uniref:uncharacterized protein n=1 Tax=Thermoascus crustaceus TaxID=5088 RepID=UPI003743069D